MSRITIVESSPTLPITRVSPTGIAASQRTSPAPPGVPVGRADGEADAAADGAAVAVDVTIGWAVGLLEAVLVEGETEHAENATASTTARALKITR
jgi:hypothetical protein